MWRRSGATAFIQFLLTDGSGSKRNSTSDRSSKAATKVSNKTVVPPTGGRNGPVARILIGFLPVSSIDLCISPFVPPSDPATND